MRSRGERSFEKMNHKGHEDIKPLFIEFLDKPTESNAQDY